MTISDEAVEAAARVMHECKNTETTFGEVARAALEAAAPFILAEAWDAGWHEHWLEWERQRKDPSHPKTKDNPHRAADMRQPLQGTASAPLGTRGIA